MQNFGVREICNVVMKAKATTTIGNKKFYKNEPVILFDTLKTSSLEGAATTVYATGGRGNTRLMSWDGERTVTFTMEDALISPEGFMILSGAGLVEASEGKPMKQHVIETIDINLETVDSSTAGELFVKVAKAPFLGSADDSEHYAYVMLVDGDGNMSEPFLPAPNGEANEALGSNLLHVKGHTAGGIEYTVNADDLAAWMNKADHILVDYYTERKAGLRQIEIEAGKFAGNFYLEAETLFRDDKGVDHAAEFIIPNCRVQSNFTFSMASTGDPSTFTFTLDAFPDFTRFDHSKKVLAALQIADSDSDEDIIDYRVKTEADK